MRRKNSSGSNGWLAEGMVSLVFIGFVLAWTEIETPLVEKMTVAAELMTRSHEAIRDCRVANGVGINEEADPNQTGYIGLESSPLTSSLGNLQAKRTTTNPDMAGLLVNLLVRAGAGQGSLVAVGASSSFPALIAATIIAAETLAAKPLVIVSLGSSEWGANVPGFGWLEMAACLREAGIIKNIPVAVSLGGDVDRGLDLVSGTREDLIARIREEKLVLINEPGLEADVEARLKIYRQAAGGKPSVFVNIGGNWANLGTNARVLELTPGLTRGVFIPPVRERGVIQAMAADGVPVIHLLNVRGLVTRYGLPLDPVPLPEPGSAEIYDQARYGNRVFTAICVVYVMFAIVLAFLCRSRLKRE